MKKILVRIGLSALVVALNSCGMNYAATGNYNLNTTQVQLANNNFRVVDTLTGSSSVTYVLMIGGIAGHFLESTDAMLGVELLGKRETSLSFVNSDAIHPSLTS